MIQNSRHVQCVKEKDPNPIIIETENDLNSSPINMQNAEVFILFFICNINAQRAARTKLFLDTHITIERDLENFKIYSTKSCHWCLSQPLPSTL